MIKYMYQFRKEGCYYGTMASKSCWRFNGFQFQYINSSVLCKRTLRKIRQNKISCNCFSSNDYSYYNHKHNTYASNAYVLYRDSYTYDLYIHTQRWQAFKKNIIHFYSICIGYFIVARISFTANNTNAKLWFGFRWSNTCRTFEYPKRSRTFAFIYSWNVDTVFNLKMDTT